MDKTAVVCMLCHKTFKRINHTHLSTKHNTTLTQYIIDFPEAELISENTRTKLSTNRVEYWVSKLGEEQGKIKYAEYTKFLGDKNKFEHKQQKLGWTIEQYNDYNANRANTQDNTIKRYGIIEGTQRWDAYRDKQRTAGISLDWFTAKYGDVVGREVWSRVCSSKSHTLNNYINRLGDDLGTKKYFSWVDKLAQRGYIASKPEQLLVDLLFNLPIIDDIWKIYSFKTKQFVMWCDKHHRPFMYDIVITFPIKVCIEFHGDYWHCNPVKYNESYTHPHRKKTAKDIWIIDNTKQELIESAGYRYITVWEKDWNQSQQQCMEKIEQCLIQHVNILQQ